VRVREETECEDVDIPYQTRTVLLEGLAQALNNWQAATASRKSATACVCTRTTRLVAAETNRFTVVSRRTSVTFAG
jgi:hypothetical protein